MIEIIILASILGGGILVDQITKILVVNLMDVGQTVPIIEDFFHITSHRNLGAAFGILSDHRWVFMVISTLAIIGIGVYLFGFCKERMLFKVGLSLIISGGIGNMIDRIFRDDGVVDMIDFRGIWGYIFNVADALVCVGAGVVMLSVILDLIKEYKKKKAKNENSK